ncbi:hypothetical protein LCGC14_2447380, partial [marine sediment metagenome]
LSPRNAEYKYMDSAGNYVALPGTWTASQPDTYIWQRIKLIIDIKASEYVRVYIDDNEFDMTGIALKTGAAGTFHRSRAEITIASHIAFIAKAYIDDLTITEEE